MALLHPRGRWRGYSNNAIFPRWDVEYTDKGGDKRFHARRVPLADRIYDAHLKQLRKEGLLP